MNEKTQISVLHFDVSPSTQDAIRRDLARLHRQSVPVTRLDVSLEGEYQHHTRIAYHVTLRAQLRDEVLFEMKQGPQLLPTVQAAADALERRLRLIPANATL